MNYSHAASIPVAQLGVDSRAQFITRTYMHLLGAIAAFVAIEVFLFTSGLAEVIARAMLSISWLIPLGLFMVASWLGSRLAGSATSKGAQYAGLGIYVFAQAIIFVPLLFVAMSFQPSIINNAAQITLLLFGCLTMIAFVTRKDFSFLRGVLMFGGIVAMVLIVVSAIFGFELGAFFMVAMIAFAGAAILYDTSNVIHHFPEDRYVGAALQLFASVALMFWYVLQLLLSLAGDD